MVLQHIFKSIFKSKLQIMALIIIVFCEALMSALFFNSINQVQGLVAELKSNNQEDFQYYPTISKSDIVNSSGNLSNAVVLVNNNLSSRYNFMYEKRQSKNVSDNGNTYLIYSSDRNIDVPIYDTGNKPLKKGEIALDANFAKEHHYVTGNSFQLKDEKYTIVGLFSLPDQISPQIDNSGASYHSDNQAILLCYPDDFEALQESSTDIFVARFNPGANINKDTMLSDTNFQRIVFKEDNSQVLANIEAKASLNKILLYASVIMLSALTLIILIITIMKKVTESQSNMGLLKALGYSNWSISSGYALYGIIILFGTLLGYLFAFLAEPTFISSINSSFLLPHFSNTINISSLIGFVILPSVGFALISILTAFILLKKPPLDLIRERGKNNTNSIVRLAGKLIRKRSFLKTVSLTSCLNNPGLLILVFLAGLSLCCMTLFSLTTFRLTSNLTDNVMKGADYVCNVRYRDTQNTKPLSDSSPYYAQSGRLIFPNNEQLNNAEIVILDNSEDDFKLYNQSTSSLININKSDGIIINQWMQKKYNLKVGDTVKIPDGDKTYTATIAGINQFISGNTVYLNFNYAKSLGIIDSIKYNGEYSRESITYDSSKHVFVSTLSDMRSITELQQNKYTTMALLILLCGVSIGIVCLVMTMKIVIQENTRYISLMKIYGYMENECNRAILSIYRIIAIIGFVIGVPYTITLSSIMFGMIAKKSNMVYPMNVSIPDIIICFVFFEIVYEFIFMLYKKSLNKVPLRQVMAE